MSIRQGRHEASENPGDFDSQAQEPRVHSGQRDSTQNATVPVIVSVMPAIVIEKRRIIVCSARPRCRRFSVGARLERDLVAGTVARKARSYRKSFGA